MPADPRRLRPIHLSSAITTYEELLKRTRHELAVVTATLSLFQRGDEQITDHRPAHVRNLFKRGSRCASARPRCPPSRPGMTTRELAVACLAAREFDHQEPVLVRAMVGVPSITLKKAVRRGEVMRVDTDRREANWRHPLA